MVVNPIKNKKSSEFPSSFILRQKDLTKHIIYDIVRKIRLQLKTRKYEKKNHFCGCAYGALYQYSPYSPRSDSFHHA